MTVSGQATKPTSKDFLVCKPPPGFSPTSGPLWICPDCSSEFIFRPVFVRELQRVMNLWVRLWDPKGQGWIPPAERRRGKWGLPPGDGGGP